MKRLRIVTCAAVTLGVALVLLLRAPRSSGSPRFATPEDCIQAYAEACKDGNVPTYLGCLAEPLRSQRLQRAGGKALLAEALRLSMADVKSWTQVGPAAIDRTTARVEVEAVGAASTQRIRFRLERSGEGWLIVAVEPPRKAPTTFRFGAPATDGD
jgi:hypothetical protein